MRTKVLCITENVFDFTSQISKITDKQILTTCKNTIGQSNNDEWLMQEYETSRAFGPSQAFLGFFTPWYISGPPFTPKPRLSFSLIHRRNLVLSVKEVWQSRSQAGLMARQIL